MNILKQALLTTALAGFAGSAQAGLELCNQTSDIQSVAIGYKGPVDWMSEGWWNIDPGKCATVVLGDLQSRFYYYRAEVNGGDFAGANYMFCTTPEEFEIVGDSNCEGRGYDSESFREIDTGESATSFTFTLVAGESAPRSEDTTPPPVNAGDDSAETGLRICNSTADIQSVSIGYENDQGFLSEGWWNLDPDGCALVIAGELQKRFYYYRSEVDGGPFEGEGFMFCTTPEVYSIQGDTNCDARGYDTESFSEIDTGPTAIGYTFYISADGNTAPPPQTNDTPDTPDTPPVAGGAGLRVCNDTDKPSSVAFGYEGAEDWTSEGWWNVDPGACVVPPLDGVNRRYFYYRTEFNGGEFVGQSYFFCTTPEAFVIVGDAECEARGYDREDFREIDTGGNTGEYTLALSAADTAETAPPEDDRGEVPDVAGDPDDERPGTDEGPATEPEEPEFDFDLPGVDDADTPEADTTEVTPEAPSEVPDLPDTPDVTPSDTPTETPDVTLPDFDSDEVDIPLVPEIDILPDVEEDTDDDPAPTRRGGSRGG